MTTDPITLDAGTDAAEAYCALCRGALRRLPLVDDGRLVGEGDTATVAGRPVGEQ